MDQLANYAQQLAELFRLHAPDNVVSATLPTAVFTLAFGVGICVLGAKLARWFITVVFAVGGLVAGFSMGGHFNLAPLVVALIGAGALGGLGFVMHRLWVGLATGLFLATVAFGVVSTKMVLPHVEEFRQQQVETAKQEVTNFEPGPVGDVVKTGWDEFWKMGDKFSAFILQKEPDVRKYGVITVIVAAGLGLLMGIFLCRLTLILFTAAFGTSLIGSGMAMLGRHVEVDMFQLCQERPDMTAAALACFFVFSIILQTLLTRKGASTASAAAKSD